MIIAALVLSIIALIASLSCLVIMLAKNYFSTHQIQYVPAGGESPMADFAKEMGRAMGSPFREIDDPMTEEERTHLDSLRNKPKPTAPPKPV